MSRRETTPRTTSRRGIQSGDASTGLAANTVELTAHQNTTVCLHDECIHIVLGVRDE